MQKKIPFIENKKPNFTHLNKYLKNTFLQNSYTNFGPMQKTLEMYISKKINISNRKVVMLNSATSGIHLLSKFFEYKLKKKIRWIICDFNFFSSNTLNLSNSIILDSNNYGCLGVKTLESYLDKHKDKIKNLGVIFTNIFGINSNWLPIKKVCRNYKMPFFIDNATGLFDRATKSNDDFEVVSFHHTKFWGFGEGGCIIVPSKYYKILKNLTNFGSVNFSDLKKYSSNFKISDISCGLIYERLKNINKKKKLYIDTSNYIFDILKKNNFKIRRFSKLKSKSIQTYTPYLITKPITQKQLDKTKYITFRKYYKPLKNLKNSKFIYDRIICISNNPDILKVKRKHIIEDFKNIIKD